MVKCHLIPMIILIQTVTNIMSYTKLSQSNKYLGTTNASKCLQISGRGWLIRDVSSSHNMEPK